LNAKEDDDGADGKAYIKGSRGDVVVLHPPTEILPANVSVEDITNQYPR
jgi:hypothetical protein